MPGSLESTTTSETWWMGVLAVLLSSAGTEFSMRSGVYHGQSHFTLADGLSTILDVLCEHVEVLGFTELCTVREQIIRDVMQWDDSFNHVRIGNIILNYLNGKLKPADRMFAWKISL